MLLLTFAPGMVCAYSFETLRYRSSLSLPNISRPSLSAVSVDAGQSKNH